MKIKQTLWQLQLLLMLVSWLKVKFCLYFDSFVLQATHEGRASKQHRSNMQRSVFSLSSDCAVLVGSHAVCWHSRKFLVDKQKPIFFPAMQCSIKWRKYMQEFMQNGSLMHEFSKIAGQRTRSSAIPHNYILGIFQVEASDTEYFAISYNWQKM